MKFLPTNWFEWTCFVIIAISILEIIFILSVVGFCKLFKKKEPKWFVNFFRDQRDISIREMWHWIFPRNF